MKKRESTWGSGATQYFFGLAPDQVLAAVERLGIRSTGRALPLGSMENRVYDVELDGDEFIGKPRVERERVVKFYRPGRWTEAQIHEEHEFLRELNEAEVPVIAPLSFAGGETIASEPRSGILYSIFPKRGGRAPEELGEQETAWLGRLIGRLHNVGATKPFRERLRLDVDTYGYANLDYLLDAKQIPLEFADRYADALAEILEISAPWFAEARYQRIHGDAHLGNFLWRPEEGPLALDFDDSVEGPTVQDLWLFVPGRDEESLGRWHDLLAAYESFRDFDRSELRLVEPLRALRFAHFSAWIAKRWDDPAFPQAFPQFGSHSYWQGQTDDMEEQVRWVRALESRAYFELLAEGLD